MQRIVFYFYTYFILLKLFALEFKFKIAFFYHRLKCTIRYNLDLKKNSKLLISEPEYPA